MKEHIHLGQWTEDELSRLIESAASISETGSRIDFLSGQFINTKYEESTLIGSVDTAECFVVNLESVDCFTFVEYIEAMRRSHTFSEFKENLYLVRYRHGMPSFKNRNHFFTDWKAFNSLYVVDVTRNVGREKCKDVSKRLNEKHDGTFFVPGIPCRLREVTYLQSVNVDGAVAELKTGDYIGIYSKEDGLDVSHVGILVKKEGKVVLRHASSVKKYRKVMDEDFMDYMKSKAGLIVLRPRD